MADDVTRGIQDLLYPRLAEFEQRLDRLDSWHKDLQDSIMLKEDRTHTNRFQEQVEGRFKHVDNELQIEKQRHERFEDLRTEQMRELKAAVDKKTEQEYVDALAKQLHTANLAVAQKAESARAEQLANQLHMLSDDVALKAKIDRETAQQLHEKMKALKDQVMERATNARAEDFARQLKALSKDISMKAEIARCEDMRTEVQHVREEVGRANAIAAGLGMQLQALGHAIARKSEQASVDQAVTQLMALNHAVARKADAGQHREVGDEVKRLREDIVAHGAEMHRVEDLSRQVEALKGRAVESPPKQAPQAPQAPAPVPQSPTPRGSLPPIGGR